VADSGAKERALIVPDKTQLNRNTDADNSENGGETGVRYV
jgi:hypothetical protein